MYSNHVNSTLMLFDKGKYNTTKLYEQKKINEMKCETQW